MENLQGGTLSLEHRYRIERRRGQRAFVTRYESLQLPFEETVWVEVYDALAEAGAEPRVFERIKESAHRAHHIDAAPVLRLLDYGELDRGIPFAVTERVEGPSLDAYVDREGPLPPSDAVALARRLAEALQSAHDRGLAHGTLSPRWITLPENDPSAARVGHFQVGVTLDELRRMDGAVLTPEIVGAFPPETFARETIPPDEVGEDHDPTDEFGVSADVWAMGAVIYESLVGFHPYFDDDTSDASDGIVRLQNEEARPLADFGIETEISDIVGRALARDAADRWSSPLEFVEALDETRSPDDAATDPPEADRPASPESGLRDPETPARGRAEHERETESDEQFEPGGPASLLVTFALLLLVASNVAWFLYVLDAESDPPTAAKTRIPRSSGAIEGVLLDSTPSGAAVYSSDREEQLGRTPFVLPEKITESPEVELQLKKTGLPDRTLQLGRKEAKRLIRIDLREENSETTD